MIKENIIITTMKNKIEFVKQKYDWDCGVATTQMILKYYNIKISYEKLIQKLNANKDKGTEPNNIIKILNHYKLKTYYNDNNKLNDLKIFQNKNALCIISYYFYDYKVDHYAILKQIKNNFVYLNDPWYGDNHKININKFNYIWKFDKKYRPQNKWICIVQK